MPEEVAHEVCIDGPDSEQNSEQRLIKSPTPSTDDHQIVLRSGASRRCEIRNSYTDKYWDMPKRASCSSFYGPGAPFGVMPSVHLSHETLLVVEQITQV